MRASTTTETRCIIDYVSTGGRHRITIIRDGIKREYKTVDVHGDKPRFASHRLFVRVYAAYAGSKKVSGHGQNTQRAVTVMNVGPSARSKNAAKRLAK